MSNSPSSVVIPFRRSKGESPSGPPGQRITITLDSGDGRRVRYFICGGTEGCDGVWTDEGQGCDAGPTWTTVFEDRSNWHGPDVRDLALLARAQKYLPPN